MFQHILIAIDGSPPGARALQRGFELAGELGGQVRIVHVVDTATALRPELGVYDNRLLDELRQQGQELLASAAAQAPAPIATTTTLLEGDPADTIVSAAAEWDADMIVLGSDSRGRLAHFLLGSTADSVIRRSPCPVLTVRQQANRESSDHVASALQIYRNP